MVGEIKLGTDSSLTMDAAFRYANALFHLGKETKSIEQHEKEILDALNCDLGKPPTEAMFEIIALLQELKLQGILVVLENVL